MSPAGISQLVGTLPGSFPYLRGNVRGRMAALQLGQDSVALVSLVDLAAPQQVDRVDLPYLASSLVWARERIVVALDDASLAVLDATDRRNPVLTTNVQITSDVMELKAVGRRVYASTRATGISVVDVTDSAAPAHLASVFADGEADDFAIHREGLVTVHFDGRKIMTAGEMSAGRVLPSGVYVVRVEASGSTKRQSVTLLR